MFARENNIPDSWEALEDTLSGELKFDKEKDQLHSIKPRDFDASEVEALQQAGVQSKMTSLSLNPEDQTSDEYYSEDLQFKLWSDYPECQDEDKNTEKNELVSPNTYQITERTKQESVLKGSTSNLKHENSLTASDLTFFPSYLTKRIDDKPPHDIIYGKQNDIIPSGERRQTTRLHRRTEGYLARKNARKEPNDSTDDEEPIKEYQKKPQLWRKFFKKTEEETNTVRLEPGFGQFPIKNSKKHMDLKCYAAKDRILDEGTRFDPVEERDHCESEHVFKKEAWKSSKINTIHGDLWDYSIVLNKDHFMKMSQIFSPLKKDSSEPKSIDEKIGASKTNLRRRINPDEVKESRLRSAKDYMKWLKEHNPVANKK